MKKYIVYAMILIALFSFTGCQNNTYTVPQLMEPVGVKLDTAAAQIGEICEISVYNGEVIPYVEELYFVVDGQLKEFKAAIGDNVTKGEVVAILDDKKLREQIKDLQEQINDTIIMGEFSDRRIAADVEIAREQLEKLELSGAKEETKKMKEIEIEMQSVKLRQAQELRNLKLNKLNDSLGQLKEQSYDLEVKAPFDGKVVFVSQVQPGDSIRSYTPVMCIADENLLSISSEYINEQELSNAHKISARIIDSDYDVTYLPYENDEFVTMMLAGEKLKTRFAINDTAQNVVSGQYAAIKVYKVFKENVLTIPSNALYRDEKGRYVYKVIDNERIRCDVTVGIINDVETEILEGLQEGDLVYVKE